jgi:hypothetical protein
MIAEIPFSHNPSLMVKIRLSNLRPFADCHFAAEISLFDFGRFLLPFLHAVLFDVAKGKQFDVVREVAGLVRRRIKLGAWEIRTLEAKVVSAFADASIRFTCAIHELAFPLERSASLARDPVPVEFFRQQFSPRWVILDLVGSAVAAISSARCY